MTGGGMVPIPGAAFGGATDPGALQIRDGFQVIPSIMVGERYDSNVFFAPPTPGLQREDFVTTTVPQVRGMYGGSLGTLNAVASAVGEYYVKNTGLNYVGTNAGAVLDMSRLVSQWREGSRLIVSNVYTYTPTPPAFLTGDLTGQPPNPYVRGYQVSRTNTQFNSFTADLVAPVTQVVNLIGSYTNGFMNFGPSVIQQAGQLLDSNFQTYMAGLSMRTSPQDTVSLTSVNSEYDYSGVRGFSSHGGTVGWSRMFTPNFSFDSAAGAKLVETTFSGSPSSTIIAPVGRLGLFWNDSTTTMTGAYSVGVTPSYQFGGQALLTHVASVNLTQQTAIPDLLGIASLSYGRGDDLSGSSSPTSAISYTSYYGMGGVVYQYTPRTFLSLIYSYSRFDNTVGSLSYLIDRQVVQLSLTQALF